MVKIETTPKDTWSFPDGVPFDVRRKGVDRVEITYPPSSGRAPEKKRLPRTV